MSMEMDERKELDFLDHGFTDWRSDELNVVVFLDQGPANKVVLLPVTVLTVIYRPNLEI